MTAALPGFDPGKRAEREQWGLLWIRDTVFGRTGKVEPMAGEEHAREMAGRRDHGYRGTVAVRRTVVTYTTGWERA